ncbi:MAG: YceI family protein [Chloroflexota bacterium]|nr:YceI family protein [Chloroflexota bacterium]
MQWNLDAGHTSLEMSVRHMGIFTVRGSFDKLSGSAETTDDGTLTSVQGTIQAASINTREPQRDTHLRSTDFLDAENYPELTFQSTKIESLGDKRYRVTGDFTIRDQTHPLTVDLAVTDSIKDPWGMTRVGAEVGGKLSRKQWGLTWSVALETGQLVVGDEIKFTVDVEAVAAPPDAVEKAAEEAAEQVP